MKFNNPTATKSAHFYHRYKTQQVVMVIASRQTASLTAIGFRELVCRFLLLALRDFHIPTILQQKFMF